MKKEKKETKKTEGQSAGRKKNWTELYASVDEIKQFLLSRVFLRHNTVMGRTEVKLLSSYDCEGSDWQPISDRIINSLWSELSVDKPIRMEDMRRVIESDFVPDFHPFRFYLEHLPQWDHKTDHIFGLSLSVSIKGNVEEQALFGEYLKKWMVSMVAGWIDEKEVNHVVLVLIGRQGTYKSTWFYYLLPPQLRQYFFTKTNSQRMSRDDKLTLTQYGLICNEELDTMRLSELNQLKAAVTMPTIDERPAYGHYAEHRKHIASFCGTGNNVEFLSDPTGNRRWLPFEVDSILSPRDNPIDYANVYAQAYALYQEGFRYWFSHDEILRLQEHNRKYEAPCLEQELIDTYFARPDKPECGEFMPVARAMQIVGGSITQKLNVFYLGRAFTDMGFPKVVRNHVRGYLVVMRSPEEIKARQRILGTEGTVVTVET